MVRNRNINTEISVISIITLLAVIILRAINDQELIGERLIDNNLLSTLLSVLGILINGILIYLFNYRYTLLRGSSIVIFIYLIFTLHEPAVLSLTKIHIAVPLIIMGIHYMVIHTTERADLASLLTSILLISTASLLFPPAIWITLFIIIFNVSPNVLFLKYLITYISGTLIPYIFYISLSYLFSDTWNFDKITDQFSSLLKVSIPDVELNYITVILMALILTLLIASYSQIIKNKRHSPQADKSLYENMLLAPLFLGISILYYDIYGGQLFLLLCTPLSYLIFNYIQSSNENRSARILIYSLYVAIILKMIMNL